MAETINHPTFGPLRFPDGMSDEEKAAAIRTLEAEQEPTQKQETQLPYSPDETALSRGIQPGPMTAFPAESYGSPNRQIPTEAKRQVVGNAVKYGLPVAASVLTGGALPTTMGAIKSASIISGASGLTGFLSELLSQDIKGEERSYRKAGAEGIAQALPVKNTGSLFKRLLFNVPSAIATQETSEYVRQGDEYEPPKDLSDAISRWGLATAFSGGASYLGSRGDRVRAAQDTAQSLGAQRQGGAVAIGERVPEFAKLEGSVVRQGNKYANKLMDEMDIGFDESLSRAFPQATDSTSDIATYLNASKTRVGAATREYDAAKIAADRAREKASVLASGDNIRAYESARAEASQLALVEQSKLMAKQSVERNVLGVNPLSISDVGFSKQVEGINDTINSAKTALAIGRDKAFSDAGVGQNTFVVSRQGVNNSISARSGRGKAFEGKIARKETRDAINAYFDKYGVDDKLTLEGMRKLKMRMADDLTKDGAYSPTAANRIAGDAYAAINSSSDNFIKRTMKESFPAWKRAQALSARDFALRETPAMQMLSNGDAEGFYSAIAREGRGQTLESISTYAQLLRDLGQNEAAEAFVSNVNQVIARGVLFKSASKNIGTGLDSLTDAIDPFVLSKEMDSLRALGFPVQNLQLGTPKQIKAAARLSSVKNNGVVSKQDLDEFIDLSGQVGESAAVAKINYYNAVRDKQIANGTSRMRKASYEARQAEKHAAITEEDKLYALTRVNQDPLVRLVEDPSFKVPTGSVNSSQFNSAILSLEPKTAKSFVEAMEEAGKGTDLHNLRKGLGYKVFSKKKKAPDGEMVIDTNGIIDFFSEKGDPRLDNQREAFKAVVGDRVYDSMVKNIVNPLRKIQRTRGIAAIDDSGKLPAATIRSKPDQSGNRAMLSLVGTVSEIKSLIDTGRYNTLYLLYANPRFAPVWSSIMRGGSTLEKQPVLATALRLAQQEDDEASQQANKTP